MAHVLLEPLAKELRGQIAMTANPEIWRAASVVLSKYGERASAVLSRRADELLTKGDADGRALAMMILGAIRELQRGPLEGETIH
jgi:hypothetical protein